MHLLPPESEIPWADLEAEIEKPEGWAQLTLREKQMFLLKFSVDPPMAHALVAKKLGIAEGTATQMWKRVRKKVGLPAGDDVTREVTTRLGRVPQGELISKIEQNMRKLLDQVPRLIRDSDLGKISQAFRDHMNARQLLLNEPTQIVGSGNRETMNEVLGMLLREARRRGVQFGTGPEGQSIIIDAEREPTSSTPMT